MAFSKGTAGAMEPITHFLTGACIGRAGLNRKTAYATLAATLAAEAADLDVLWGFGGPVEGLKHHRGITHTFLGVPMVVAVVVGAVWVFDRWRRRRKPDVQPIHWGWLCLTAFIAALSHILLDWTNNYGVRPFFPFNPRWYAGSFVFIAEPVFWFFLLLAFVMPWLLGLADREIGVRRQQFRGRGWAIFALTGMALVGCLRWTEHARGLKMLDEAQVTSEPVTRMALEPYPVTPFRWHGIVETQDFFQTAEIRTWGGATAVVSDPGMDVLYKPASTPAVEAAKQTLLGKTFLDWGTWAVVRDVGPVAMPALTPPELPPGRTWTTVEFQDLRFAYSFTSTRSGGRAPLGGWVYVVDGREEAGEGMNGREQR
jgi:inner membrane protein